MYDHEKAEKVLNHEKNEKKLKKMRKKVEEIERNEQSYKENGGVYIVKSNFSGSRKFEKLINVERVKKGMPVVVDGKVGIYDFGSGRVMTTDYDVSDAVGFTLNVYCDSLLVVCGMKDFLYSDKIVNALTSRSLCTVKVPRIFHSSVIHESKMYIIGGEALTSDYSVIEEINLLSPTTSTLIPLKSEILSPLSLFSPPSQIITRFTTDLSQEKEYEILVFDVNTNNCSIQRLEHDETFKKFEHFDSFYNENWTPSQMVSIGDKNFLYLIAKNIIVNTLAPLSDVININ